MTRTLDQLFGDFDRGRISRRELFQALGLAIAIPSLARAQGRGGAPADTTHAPAPFEATGWKTVWLDHITYQCTDGKKAAPFFSAVMGWKVRSDDGKKIVMDIGDDVGGFIITSDFVAPPPPPAPPTGDTTGRGGRGGGRGNRPTGRISNFAWGIAPWDTNKVEAELKKRGLNPVADHQGSDFKSFHIKDPDGFDIQLTNGTKANRRKGSASGKLPGPTPFEPTGWKTMWLDHISYGCTDFKRTVAFYEALLSWQARSPNNRQATVDIGDVGGAIIRNNSAGTTVIDHISFGIDGFDPDKVEAELIKRKLGRPDRSNPEHLTPDTGSGGEIHTARFKSYHTPDPFGWDLQISNIVRANRHDG